MIPFRRRTKELFAKAPSTHNLKYVENTIDLGDRIKIDDVYYPARPEGEFSLTNRLKCAWLVFTGKADALIWPGNQ